MINGGEKDGTDDDLISIIKKGVEDYVPAPFYNKERIMKGIAGDLIKVAKKLQKIAEAQKNTKLILGNDEIKSIVENKYKELIKEQLKEEIVGKKGIIHQPLTSIRKFFGFTTAGLVAFVIIALITYNIYIKNKTTAGKILQYQSKTNSLTSRVNDYEKRIILLEKAQEDIASLKKSVDEIAASSKAYTESVETLKGSVNNIETSQKNLEEQFKAKTGSYDKLIEDFKKSGESYKKEFEELKTQNKDNAEKFNDLEKKINELDKKYERKAKEQKE